MSGRSVVKLLLALCTGIIVAGCDSSASTDTGGGSSMDAMASAIDAQKAAQQQVQAQADAERAAAEAQQVAAEQQAAEQERRVAGREPVAPGGYASAIIGARRHVLNRVESLAWQQAVSHFQAEHGRLPKDHDEFMKRVITPLGIDLGFKEENQEFLYDPNDKTQGPYGTLFVVESAEQPAGNPTAAPQNR
jgi:hypothetical protein